VAAKAALGLPADPDDPQPKPVDLGDPLFAPRKVKGSQANTLDKYLEGLDASRRFNLEEMAS
jgi:hypothetical protein